MLEERNVNGQYDAGIVVLMNFVRSIFYPLIHEKVYYRLWRKLYGGINLKVLFSTHISLAEKLRVILATVHLYPRKRNRVY